MYNLRRRKTIVLGQHSLEDMSVLINRLQTGQLF